MKQDIPRQDRQDNPLRVTIARPVVVYNMLGQRVGKGWIRDHDTIGDEVVIVSDEGQQIDPDFISLAVTGEPEIQFVIRKIQ